MHVVKPLRCITNTVRYVCTGIVREKETINPYCDVIVQTIGINAMGQKVLNQNASLCPAQFTLQLLCLLVAVCSIRHLSVIVRPSTKITYTQKQQQASQHGIGWK